MPPFGDKQTDESAAHSENAHTDGQTLARRVAAYSAAVVLGGAAIAGIAVVALSGGNDDGGGP